MGSRRRRRIAASKKDLEKGIKEDARACSLLKEKITTWHIVAQARITCIQGGAGERIEIVKKRAEKQAQAIELYRRQRIIVPAAIEKAETLLEKKFASKDRAHATLSR